MPKKKNAFLARVDAQIEAEKLETHRFTRQMMVDLSYIALNKAFGFGADRLKKYADTLLDVYTEYADMWNGDTADTEYSRAALDKRLQQIFGPDFHAWEIRYGHETKREAKRG